MTKLIISCICVPYHKKNNLPPSNSSYIYTSHVPPFFNKKLKISMGFNNMAMFKVCCFLLLLLLGVTTSTNASHFDDQVLLSNHQDDHDPNYSKSSATFVPCCDHCICTKSQDQPPQCHCNDYRLGGCHSACVSCYCPLFVGTVPMCICRDINNFCYKRCNSSN